MKTLFEWGGEALPTEGEEQLGKFLTSIKGLPGVLAELANDLHHSSQLFSDAFFDLSQEMGSSLVRLRQGSGRSRAHAGKSVFLSALRALEEQFPSALEQCRVVYVEEVGLAFCEVRVNGHAEQVLLDDFFECSKLEGGLGAREAFIEKAYAKVMGSYRALEELEEFEVLEELTGWPQSHFELQPTRRPPAGATTSFGRATQRQEMLVRAADGGTYLLESLAGGNTAAYPVAAESFFRFRLEEAQELSIRLSQINSKLVPRGYSHEKALLELYCGEELQLVAGQLGSTRRLYPGSTFLSLPAESYLLRVRVLGRVPKAHLVVHGRTPRLKEAGRLEEKLLARLPYPSPSPHAALPASRQQDYRLCVTLPRGTGGWVELCSQTAIFERSEWGRRRKVRVREVQRQRLSLLLLEQGTQELFRLVPE